MDNRNSAFCGKSPKPVLTYLISAYVVSLVAANVLSNNMLLVFGMTTSAGILTFPITYIIASIIGEVYGYSWARKAAWLSLAAAAVFALLLQLSLILPYPSWFNREAFAYAMGGTWRITFASLCAFTFGKWTNDSIFAKLKQRSKKAGLEGFLVRALCSSLPGHILDTMIFNIFAFAGIIPWASLPGMIVISVALKWGYEWLSVPLKLWLVKKVYHMEMD